MKKTNKNVTLLFLNSYDLVIESSSGIIKKVYFLLICSYIDLTKSAFEAIFNIAISDKDITLEELEELKEFTQKELSIQSANLQKAIETRMHSSEYGLKAVEASHD